MLELQLSAQGEWYR